MQKTKPQCQPQSQMPPPTQFPPLQKSFTVQTLRSSQAPVRAEYEHAPVEGSQPSIVQGLPSSQLVPLATASQSPMAVLHD